MRVLTDQIFAINEGSGTLIVPYRIEVSGFNTYDKKHIAEVVVLFAKGELRMKDQGIKCSENTAFLDLHLSKTNPILESQFKFTIGDETMNLIEKYRKGDLQLSLSVVFQAAIYEELILGNNQRKSYVSGFNKGHGHVDFEIQQSYWVNKVLPQTGFDPITLIELPSISAIIPLEYKKSITELEEAKVTANQNG